jgi:hypothetical protein
MRFGDFITRIAAPTTLDRAPSYATEWVDSDQVTPCIYYIAGREIIQIKNGAQVRIGSPALAANASGAALHDDGSGIPYLYVGEGASNNIQRMNLANSVTTAAGTLVRDKLASISGFLYGSVSQSGGTWSGVAFTLPGADPFVAANWSSVTTVGWPQTPINSIHGIRGIPIVMKPEGIFVYNRNRDLWENRMMAWEMMPHPDNGRVAFSIGNTLIIAAGRGGAIMFDGFNIRDFSPWDAQALPDLDTTQQSFAAMASTPYGIMGITTAARSFHGGPGSLTFALRTRGVNFNSKITHRGGADDNGADVLGTRFFRTTDNEANFTDYTSNMGDGSYATVAVLDSQDTGANGDYFYIGHPRPFQGVLLVVTAPNGNSATLSAEVWNGSAWVSVTIRDFTDVSAATLGQTHMIMMTQDPVAALTWTEDTMSNITSGGSADTQSCFYMRFLVSAALDANVEIAQVHLLPWRPSIDTTNFPEDGMDRAGCFAHLLLGGQMQNGGSVWHDLGAIMTAQTDVDDISLLITAQPGGSYGNSDNKIVAIGRRAVFLFEGGLAQGWPFISPAGLAEMPFITPSKGRTTRLRQIRVFGRNFDGVSNSFFYWRYSPTERWSRKAMGNRMPAVIEIPEDTGGGTEFQWTIGYTMTLDTTARRPTFTAVDADFEIVEGSSIESSVERGIPAIPRG